MDTLLLQSERSAKITDPMKTAAGSVDSDPKTSFLRGEGETLQAELVSVLQRGGTPEPDTVDHQIWQHSLGPKPRVLATQRAEATSLGLTAPLLSRRLVEMASWAHYSWRSFAGSICA